MGNASTAKKIRTKPKTWIDSVLEATKSAECPRSFIFWATLFCIGVCTKRNIKLPRSGLWHLYPNLYILLIAESGLGKQFAIDTVKNLLNNTGKVRIVSGTQSIQGIISTLSKATTIEKTGCLIRNAEGAFVTGEFTNFLIKDDLSLTQVMEWYDTHAHDVWEKVLKNEKYVLKNVFTSLIAATNMELFTRRVPDQEAKGGFLARMLPIKEDEVTHLNSLTKIETPIDWIGLSERLSEICELKGEFVYGEGAAETYDNWYYPFYGNKQRIHDKARFTNRLRDHILKVAMCLSLSYKNDLVLTSPDIEAAIKLCVPLIETVQELASDMGQSRYKGLNAMVVQQLIHAKNHRILRSKLIGMNKGEWTLQEFNGVIDLLQSMETVEMETINGQVYIVLSQKALEQLSKMKGAN